ncbi:MAG: SusC/RagA family TonB-linked outer membrane protein, partial [Pyrinomonadaceae bacterium]|nr:SusC/RagA family TonB-linked outer membrane protein [Sphingobacteriaceae bacterium]
REARSLGYTTQKIDGDELTKARETNVINALAGKIAGVRVTSQSGTLGGSAKIVIRGQSSFGGDPTAGQPIFVVDGLPIDNSSQQLGTAPSAVPQGPAGVDFGNRAGDINSDDIESINVLKGAAATALYGARAKNGAIIITTKKGKNGSAVINFNSSTRYDSPFKLPSYQNEYAQGNYGAYAINSTNGWGPKISEVTDTKYPNFMDQQVNLQAFPDNVSEFYKTGNSYINSLSFEGGNETSDLRIGFTNTYQNGIVEKESLHKNSINLNAGKVFSSKFNVRTNLNYVSNIGKNRPIQASNNSNSLVQIVQFLPRTVDVNALKANYSDPITGQQITLTPARTGNNPYWVINNNTSENDVERIYGNLILNFKPLEWLTVSNNFGTDMYNEFRKLVVRPGTSGFLTGNFFQANLFNRTLNNDLIISADRKITNDIGLKALAGYNVYETYYRRDQGDATGLTVDQLYTFANAASVVNGNTSNKKRIQGVFAGVDLSYKNFLYLSATGRNDWSSTLPIDNRSYFYPSVSTSFVFSEIVPANNILSFGKIRASWANVGSDTDPYQLAFNYTAVSQAFAQYSQGSQFPFNGLSGFSIPATIPNSKLKPQNQISFEVGTDLRFLKDRVRLDFNYYNTKTSDQIVALALPQSTGFATKRLNAGAIQNNGIEVLLGGTPIKTRGFTYDLDVNFSKNKQSIEELPAEIAQYTVASAYSGLQIRARNGEQLGIWGTGFERDPQGNYVINASNGLRRIVTDQRLGNLYPDWMMGINNTLSFKGISLGFLVDIRKGGVMYSGTVAALRSTGLAEETLTNRGKIFVDKGVIKNADGTFSPNTVPVQSLQDFWSQFGTNTATEPGIFDASYVKLREVTLSYVLPSKLFGNNKFIKGASLGVEGRNLWLIDSKVPHIDPEVNLFGSTSVGEGVEFYNMPSARTFGFNLRARF